MVTAQTRVATSTNPAVKFIRDRLLPLILRRDAVQRRLVPRMLGLEAPFKTPALRNVRVAREKKRRRRYTEEGGVPLLMLTMVGFAIALRIIIRKTQDHS